MILYGVWAVLALAAVLTGAIANALVAVALVAGFAFAWHRVSR